MTSSNNWIAVRKHYEHMWTTDLGRYRLVVVGDSDPLSGGEIVRTSAIDPTEQESLLIEDDDIRLEVVRNLLAAGVIVERMR